MKKKILTSKGTFTTFSPCYSGYYKYSKTIVSLLATMQAIPILSFFEYFCFDESETAEKNKIVNTPTNVQLIHMLKVANFFIDVMYELLMSGIISEKEFSSVKVNSFFRSKELNFAVGGTPSSLHCHGLALDFKADTNVMNAFFEHIEKYYINSNLLSEYQARYSDKELKDMIYPFEIINYYNGIESNTQYIHIGFKFIVPMRENQQNVLPF